jgi:PAS domain S-box-containing protein
VDSPSQASDALRIVLGTVLDAVVVIDAEGAVTGWNAVAERVFGWTADEAVGRNLNELIVPAKHREAHLSGMHRYQRTGEARVLNRRIEISALDKAGREFPIELSITPAPAGTGAAFIGFMRDISERREAEAALRDARSRAQELASEREAILSQLGEAVILADAEGKLTFVNEAAEQLHGVRLLGVGPDDYSATYHLLTEDGLPYPSHELPLARAVRGETVSQARWRVRRPDGSVALAVGSAKPLLSPEGRQVGAVLTARDETERDRAERQVRENEARLRAVTDNLPGGAVYQIWMSGDGAERRFVYLSQSYERLTGVAAAAVLENPALAYEAIWAEDRPRFAEAEQEAIRTRSPFDVQARLRRGDGETRWCRFISAPRDQADASIIWDGLLIDISQRIQAEIALRELNADLERKVAEEVAARERVWSVSRDLIVVIAADGTYRKLNPAWRSEMGYDPEALVGTPFDGLAHPDDLAAAREAFAALQAGEPVSDIDVRIRAADGSYRAYSWTCVAEADGIYAAGRDITRRIELEEQLRQSQKMEAVGQLTGGIAHDFNNLLTIIRSAVDMMRHRDLPEERRARYVDAIAETVDRASRLTGQLLAFARRQPLKPEIVDVSAQVPIVTDLVRPLLGSRIDIALADGVPPLFARVDLSQFETALMNLLLNARDAMEGEGRVAVGIAEADRLPSLRGEAGRSGEFIAITVADTGRGIDPDRIDRIFEPFFTTKDVGKGTGLGLSQVYGFVRQSGGDIAVESRPGEGSTFTVYLPRTAAAPDAANAETGPAAAAVRKGMRVLVVEDDERVGQFSTEALHDLGHETTLVAGAAEALEVLERDDLHFDVVFSDVMMAGMSGLDLAQAIRARYPGLPVLLTSGYSEVIAKEGAFGFPLLRKPYSVEALSRALRKAVRS